MLVFFEQKIGIKKSKKVFMFNLWYGRSVQEQPELVGGEFAA